MIKVLEFEKIVEKEKQIAKSQLSLKKSPNQCFSTGSGGSQALISGSPNIVF